MPAGQLAERKRLPARAATSEEALVLPKKPGLKVHVAPLEHLLAMKLVALRQRDVPDVVALVEQLGLREEPADRFTDLLLDVYHAVETLAMALGVPDDKVVEETRSIGRWVVAESGRRPETKGAPAAAS